MSDPHHTHTGGPMSFVSVYRKDTGEKVRIPAHWLGTSLGKPFRKTPLQKASENTPPAGGKPATDDTRKDT